MANAYVYKKNWKRLGAACFDAVGSILFSFQRRSFPVDKQRIRKILVIRLDHIGDVLMTRPAIAALHQAFPSAQIDLLTSAELAPLFEDAREIREIISMQHHWFARRPDPKERCAEYRYVVQRLRGNHYDLAIDFRGDLRHILIMLQARIPIRAGYGITGGGFLLTHTADYHPQVHQSESQAALLRSLGIPVSKLANYPIPYSGSRKWRFWNAIGKLLPGDSRRIVIHAGAGYPGKQWPAVCFQELIEAILKENLGQVILIGTDADKSFLNAEGPGIHDLRGKTTLEDLPVLLDCCDLFIGNDSGPAHIAAAQGHPMIVLFSDMNKPEAWKPLSDNLNLFVFPAQQNNVTPDAVLKFARQTLSSHPPVSLP